MPGGLWPALDGNLNGIPARSGSGRRAVQLPHLINDLLGRKYVLD